MVKIIGMCDPHFSAYSPPSWKVDSYWKETKGIIQQVFSFGRTNEVDAYIWAGDMFNLKSQARNPFWFISELIELLRGAGAPHYVIAGNHDVKFGSLKGLKGQPLDLLVQSGVVYLLDNGMREIKKHGVTVRVWGQSYTHGNPPLKEVVKKEEEGWDILLGHFWFGVSDTMFYGERMYSCNYFSEYQADAYLIGHHHEYVGVLRDKGKVFIAPGSINRTGVHVADRDRKPAAAYIECGESIEVSMIKPKVKELSELVDMERKEEMIKEKEEIKKFLEDIKEVKFGRGSVKERVASMDIEDRVKEEVLSLLEEVNQ